MAQLFVLNGHNLNGNKIGENAKKRVAAATLFFI